MSMRIGCAAPVARRHGSGRGLGLLLGLWLLGLMAVTAPHLVHHAFDEDGGADCSFLDTAHHAPAVSGAPVLAQAPVAVGAWLVVSRPSVRPRTAPALPRGRGPPALPLALA